MKKAIVFLSLIGLIPLLAIGEPMKVALLDFTDETGAKPDAAMGGGIDTRILAGKGADLLTKCLLEQKAFTLVDRRDFVANLERSTPKEISEGVPRPAFIQAAQLLGADAVLGGSLSSFSTRKEKIDQGGYSTEFTRLTVRVTVRALDAVDGAVIAVEDASSEQKLRQTDSVRTELGEEDVLLMMEEAITRALPKLVVALSERQAAPRKAKVKVDVDATDNPALVEIDGVLVGTTPVVGLEVYQGDHTLSISRPGYVTMAKRIVLDKDFKIGVPMFRTDLTAEERKALMEKAEIKAYLINGKPDMLIQAIGD